MQGEPGGRPAPMRLAIAPDAPLVVAGTAAMLSVVAPEIDVVCLTATSEDPGRVDVLLYDPQRHQLAEFSFLTGSRALAVAYCWSTRPDIVDEARRHGAAAFMSKELTGDEVVTAVRALRAGHHHRFLVQPYTPPSTTPARLAGLTERELDVLELITEGHSNDDIARRLFLSINSVKSYVRTAYRKIGATRRSQAVLWGVEHGLGPTGGGRGG